MRRSRQAGSLPQILQGVRARPGFVGIGHLYGYGTEAGCKEYPPPRLPHPYQAGTRIPG